MERGQRDKVKVDERRLQQLVRGFAADWKKSIETLNQDIMQSFTNFKNGTAILQVSLDVHYIAIDGLYSPRATPSFRMKGCPEGLERELHGCGVVCLRSS